MKPTSLATALSLLSAITLGAGCVAGTDDDGEADGADDVGLTDGKADGTAYSACELGFAVNLINAPSTTAATLRHGGVNRLAANSLMKHRDGRDGRAGTPDDRAYRSITEVDATRWVGRRTIAQLVDLVADACAAATFDSDITYATETRQQVALPFEQGFRITQGDFTFFNLAASTEVGIFCDAPVPGGPSHSCTNVTMSFDVSATPGHHTCAELATLTVVSDGAEFVADGEDDTGQCDFELVAVGDVGAPIEIRHLNATMHLGGRTLVVHDGNLVVTRTGDLTTP